MIRTNQILSILALALLAATIPVPVMRVDDPTHDALATNAIEAASLTPIASLIVPGAVITVLMIVQSFTGWRPRVWALIGYAGALCLTVGAFGAFAAEHRPSIMWDGVDDQGRPTGGMEVADPWLGLLLIVCAAGVLAQAATLQLLRDRQTPPTPPTGGEPA